MSPPPALPAARPLAGALWMLASGLCFVAVNAIVKHLGSEVPAAQSAFLRFALGLVFLLPVLPALAALKLPPSAWRLFALRGVIHTGAVLGWFYALSRIPLAEVSAIGFLTPVWVTLGAALLLGERFALRRGLAVAAAIAGGLVILRPGFRELTGGHLAMLASATCFAGSYLIAKRATAFAGAPAIVAILSVSVTVGLAPVAAAVWVPLTLREVALLGIVAGLATLAHYTMTLAFRCAPISVTQPVTFLQLVWSTLLGVALFAEPAEASVLVGGAVIMAAVSYITWREAVLRRAPITPPAAATKL